ncbi:MAG: hypothetical protein OIN66_02410 [Candidatus Methanoperedens sp.]|nr:hypothetical protein [Candidatus Methanoperedens sp.]
MRAVELAQSLADYFQCPVKVCVRNPVEYRQKDNSLILRADSIQKLPIEERRKIARQIVSHGCSVKRIILSSP